MYMFRPTWISTSMRGTSKTKQTRNNAVNSSKKLLGAKGIDTRNKGLTSSNKKLVETISKLSK